MSVQEIGDQGEIRDQGKNPEDFILTEIGKMRII